MFGQTSHVSEDFDSFEVFCKIPLDWDLSNIFLMTSMGLWVLERKTVLVKGYFHHMIAMVCDLSLLMLTLANPVPALFYSILHFIL